MSIKTKEKVSIGEIIKPFCNQDLPSVVMHSRSWSFRELDNYSNQIANLLLEKGVKENDVVALCMERSFFYIAAMLGVAKSGAAFLPIDTEYPLERIQFLVANSNAGIVLCDEKSISKLPQDILRVSITDKALGQYSDEFTEKNIALNDLAYVIYTSGSTGTPKGVMIEWFSLLQFIESIQKVIPYEGYQSIIAMATVTFDVSIMEILVSILLGKTVIFPDEEELKNPGIIGNLIEENSADLMIITPSRLNLLLEAEVFYKKIKTLKAVIITGEKIYPETLKNLKNYTSAKIFNGYGPTETTLGCFFNEIIHGKDITVGKPLDGMNVLVLDSQGEKIENGKTGEIYLSGTGLARGYINADELTANSFLVNNSNNSRMYKTGDMGYLTNDNSLVIAGRNDRQIKFRGMRIELNEIEEFLIKHPEVKSAAVVVKNKESKAPQLCGYYTSNENICDKEIKDYLGKQLPRYMVPAFLIPQDKLPVTFSGKTDYQKLEAMDLPTANVEVEDIDAKNWSATEKRVREILFNLEDANIPAYSLDINDSILNWGVDSMLYLVFVLELEEKFNFKFDLSKISLKFFPTVKSFIDHIETV